MTMESAVIWLLVLLNNEKHHYKNKTVVVKIRGYISLGC